MQEQWREIKGYDGYYKISNRGRVKSFKHKKNGRIIKPFPTVNNYLQISLYKNNKRSPALVHRLVLEAFVGINPKLKTNHKDGDKTNNNLTNLEYCTHSENVKHAYTTNLMSKKGERHHLNKLTAKEVLEIRNLSAKGTYSRNQLAEIYKVTASNISAIVLKRSWRHI